MKGITPGVMDLLIARSHVNGFDQFPSNAIAPVKAFIVMQASTAQPNFWVKPGPPQASVAMDGDKQTIAQLSGYFLRSPLSVVRRNITSLRDHDQAEHSSVHQRGCKGERTCGPKSPHDDDPRDETQTLVGLRDACRMMAIFSIISWVWLRSDPELSAKSIKLSWPDCNA